MTDASAVRRAVGAVIDPELRLPLADLDMVRDVRLDGGTATVAIDLTIVGCPAADRIEADVRRAAASVDGVAEVAVEVGVMSPAQRTALVERIRGTRRMPFTPDSLTRVLAVTSGKGGVGKSTLTANLAVALAARGLAVGLIDADVHGFSIPGLLGLVGPDGRPPQPTRIDDLMLPPVAHGVKVISIGMFLPPDAPAAVAWRGPMLHRTVQQFLTDVHFGDLDVLVIDMPPGTGDVAISVGQLLPHADVLVVTTPQAAAADVAVRSGLVARQTGQRPVGVVENMSALTLPDGTVLDLFGSGGGAAVAAALQADGDAVPLLGSVPLSPALRAGGDTGVPVVIGAPDDPAARAIGEIADALRAQRPSLAGRGLPFSRT
ncbi:Mrp/NBP35 family ATP-binding protein [Microbacterium sp. EYE_5]|uniref:Mrp/NBP35 family ATP-binding protein n=1 Tax=unclassified Microbacterium TaxID=2609290 RepID=UPI00200353F1|nr:MULTISPECIES: Mrp/NBP35 family ATP-binding protein [unclassified Microbacterium]MCK6081033.1 Mrp/NBP35 family ATP-binding protein [Microbacterium sp. EYE_382]MCK6086303.1 Mrp/NBP35 family ATP-binding protein [Microbacterium sp. EYE_384]MCK6124199.1 Mrp/NBP35 family ATP-binding protein [Microbacterium sp. EYE_80]MCK6127108.1 Mrp/NBP35 family ATP-binding protein [Microbacterium sp. EYE_79]MCK6141988.1 Mrp/NBP35 family ATP-binding protein [Microbacterium sp. EYE_39]